MDYKEDADVGNAALKEEDMSHDVECPEIHDANKQDLDDRVCKNVPFPFVDPPKDEQFFTNMVSEETQRRIPNIKVLKEHFLNEGPLSYSQVSFIMNTSQHILEQEQNLLEINVPINICGDIHGQFYDLVKLFSIGGDFSDTSYLFLGDYVDRGYFSVECLLYLLSLKICYPDRVFLLRGNHECKHVTQYFSFKEECVKKYNEEVYNSILSVFNALPLAAIVNNQFFCVHGGISPHLTSIEDIRALDRFQEPPITGLFCDLLWSDPEEDYDRAGENNMFLPNYVRKCSFTYSFSAVKQFLNTTGLLCVIRAHEPQSNGYRMYRKDPITGFPTLITVFSAPNYVDIYNNKAAILKYDGKILNIRQFCSSPHPYCLPKFVDVFSWSFPYVCEKILELLISLLSAISANDLKVSSESILDDKELKDEHEQAYQALRKKIVSISKFMNVYSQYRLEKEEIIKSVSLSGPEETLVNENLLLGANKMTEVPIFENVRDIDLANEQIPPLPGGKVAIPSIEECESGYEVPRKDSVFKKVCFCWFKK